MRLAPISFALLLTNDDGWATAAIRALHDTLVSSNISSIISAPADNQSGTGSLDAPPVPLTRPCQFNTCPVGSPPAASNGSDVTLNYVNSYPVTAVKYGLDVLAPQLFGDVPDLVVSGPNVGTNTGLSIFMSGTIGAADAAAQAGIPAIAVSSTSGAQVSYTARQANDTYALHAEISLRFISALISEDRTPSPLLISSSYTRPTFSTLLLPRNTFLSINIPPTSPPSPCTTPDTFRFVLTRSLWNPLARWQDPPLCNRSFLPLESEILAKPSSCEVTVTLLSASTKLGADKRDVAWVARRLHHFLSCPEEAGSRL